MAQLPISGQQLESASKALFNQSQWAQYGQGAVKQLTAAEQAIANQRIAAEMRAMGYGQKPVAATGAAGAGLAGYLGTLGGATLPQIAGMGAGAMGIAGAGIAGAGLAGYAAGTALDNLPRAWGGEKISETLGGAMAPMFDKGPRQTNIPENLNQLLAESPNPASQQALGSISGGGAVEGVPFNGQKEENNGLLPSYDDGTKYVPEDQLAQLHKGEMIVPADQNPYNSKLASAFAQGTPLADYTGPSIKSQVSPYVADTTGVSYDKALGAFVFPDSQTAPPVKAAGGWVTDPATGQRSRSMADFQKEALDGIMSFWKSPVESTKKALGVSGEQEKATTQEQKMPDVGFGPGLDTYWADKLNTSKLPFSEFGKVSDYLAEKGNIGNAPASQRIDQLVGKLSKYDESRGWRTTMSNRAKDLEESGFDTSKLRSKQELTDAWRTKNAIKNEILGSSFADPKAINEKVSFYRNIAARDGKPFDVDSAYRMALVERKAEKMVEDKYSKYSWFENGPTPGEKGKLPKSFEAYQDQLRFVNDMKAGLVSPKEAQEVSGRGFSQGALADYMANKDAAEKRMDKDVSWTQKMQAAVRAAESLEEKAALVKARKDVMGTKVKLPNGTEITPYEAMTKREEILKGISKTMPEKTRKEMESAAAMYDGASRTAYDLAGQIKMRIPVGLEQTYQ